MSATYPKIKDLEVNLLLLKRAEVVVTEKIHGANFRILIPVGGDVENVSFGTKGSRIKPGSFFAQFLEAVQAQIALPDVITALERDHAWTLFGELFGPAIQKELPYLIDGIGIRFFDIMRDGALLAYDEFLHVAAQTKLPVVPELYRGIPDMSIFQQLVHKSSSVAPNAPREGIVIRDPSLTLLDGNLPLAKFKNEPFREKDYGIAIEEFMTMADEEEKARNFVNRFVTEIRLKKMFDVLREHGQLTGTRRDIAPLSAEMLRDIQTEDADYYAELDSRIAARLIAQRVNRLFSALLERGRLHL